MKGRRCLSLGGERLVSDCRPRERVYGTVRGRLEGGNSGNCLPLSALYGASYARERAAIDGGESSVGSNVGSRRDALCN